MSIILSSIGFSESGSSYTIVRAFEAGFAAYHIIITICICLHVPDYLMAKQLRDFGRLKDESFNVSYQLVSCVSIKEARRPTQTIGSQGLDDLRDKKESQFYRVRLEYSHSILQYERVVPVSWLEVDQSSDWWDCGPHWKPLNQHQYATMLEIFRLTRNALCALGSSLSPSRKCRA